MKIAKEFVLTLLFSISVVYSSINLNRDDLMDQVKGNKDAEEKLKKGLDFLEGGLQGDNGNKKTKNNHEHPGVKAFKLNSSKRPTKCQGNT